MTVRVFVRSDFATGFELAGLTVTRVDVLHHAAEAIRQAAASADVGLVLVDEALYHALPRDLLSRLDREALPILVPIPTPHRDGEGDAEAYILNLLSQAIGYRVRLR
jgi:vacuolar-type H+-ATPase subunit F/Vma7